MKRILVTGGAGFVGHHLVEHLLKRTDWQIVVIDRLNYASGGFDRLRDINAFDDKRVTTLSAPIDRPIAEGLEQEIGQVDFIVHMAAESHVDRSIANPLPFVESNVLGTFYVLEFARRQKALDKMIMFSTDEVYGPAPDGVFHTELDRHSPANPYAASKSASEMLCLAWANTYKLPVIITNTMNVYGERQHPEKFIPSTVRKVLDGERVTVHGTPDLKRAGSRFYIHGRNVADAVLFLLTEIITPPREAWNIVGELEMDNLQLAKMIASILGRPLLYDIVDFHGSRPGHDLRYALDGHKLAAAGWTPPVNFAVSLRRTVQWMVMPQHKQWLWL
jgi:dTDP-glucose 4,6-dehydratase